jgi:signal transduction histidine kinase
LLLNAVQAQAGLPPAVGARAEPPIRVSTGNWGDRGVWIQVADQGPGIPTDLLPRVFTPFFTTKAAGQGSGLGLSVSYMLIRRYGGDIGVESSPAGGIRFTLWMLSEPCLLDDEALPSHPAAADPNRADS